MIARKGFVLAAVLLTWGLPALAQEGPAEMRPYLSGMFSHVFEQDDRDALVGGGSQALESGNGLQLGVGLAINRRWGLEVSAFGHHFDQGVAGSPGIRDFGVKIDGLHFYGRDPGFSPYFGVGVGAVRTKVEGEESASEPMVDVGLGFIKYFNVSGTDLGLRGDLRYRHIFLESDAFGQSGLDEPGEAVLKIGLVVPLGKAADAPVEAAAPPPPPAACPDADGDGVCDDSDACLETPTGVQVDEQGCPPSAGVGPAERVFEDIHFAFDQSRLTDYAQTLLDDAARVINALATEYPDLRVRVSGHTDWVGTDGYNLGLSERRANIVRDYLQRKGVDGGRILIQAFGESRPQATNETDEGRALNRRAEVSVTGN